MFWDPQNSVGNTGGHTQHTDEYLVSTDQHYSLIVAQVVLVLQPVQSTYMYICKVALTNVLFSLCKLETHMVVLFSVEKYTYVT